MRQTAQEELKLVIQQINELTKIYHNAVSSLRTAIAEGLLEKRAK